MGELSDDSIGEYYERIDRKKREAWRKVRDARERGASWDEIRKLEEAAHDAGNTGD